ncbi:MAG: hypothetical protein M1812_005102 [Candelaria pacifica]|nr:MAG: hypothetical protein M1812_005102 [Candelaria pacifica]
MFYSHEVLTSRKYGVATVWLVATLGSKSALKKVNRKAILEVDVPKACETILTPEAPMALRLQSNLLYGVSRVYLQQCGYVLADAQSAQNNIKALLRVVRSPALDMDATGTRPDQLLIQDDPAFLAETALPGLGIDFANLELISSTASLRSSLLSPGSPHSSQTSNHSAEDSLLGLIIPSTDTGGFVDVGGFTLPRDELESFHGNDYTNLGGPVLEDDSFFPEVDFEFDADGNQRDVGVAERERRQLAAGYGRAMLGSDSAASGGQVRREHEEATRAGFNPTETVDIGNDPPLADDFDLPEALPFSPLVIPDEKGAGMAAVSSIAKDEESSSDLAEAFSRRKRPAPRKLQMDTTMELRSAELTQWNNEYVENMIEISKQKQRSKLQAQAKKNALFWISGRGIGGIALGLGSSHLKTPLGHFGDELLLEAITSVRSELTGKKRDREGDGDEDPDEERLSENRRVRSRQDDGDQVGRGDDAALQDEAMMLIYDEEGLEIGRDAPSELLDRSTAMPWNLSASGQGSQQGSSIARGRSIGGSFGGFPTSIAGPSSLYGQEQGSQSRRISRLTSASPLLGRGRASGLERLSSIENLENEEEAGLLGGRLASDDYGGEDGFQLYGPGAEVDTQTAAQSQWMKTTLNQESFNFLEFVKDGIIKEQQKSPHDFDDDLALLESSSNRYVMFETLLPPAQNTKVVAAQALLHTLALATKHLLGIDQFEAYGEIKLSVIANV